jgi:hypothetical protein
MIKDLSIDKLTKQILNAMIRRTLIVLQQIEEQEIVEYYEGEFFTWNYNVNEPTLTLDYQKDIVHLYWNKETSEDKMEVYSDIKDNASGNLSYYVGLENLLYTELAELSKDIEPKQLEINFDEEEEDV